VSQVASVQATETTFELHTLGWKAFQSLCATVVSEILGQTFQIFSSTEDAGRDGAFRGKWKSRKGQSWKGSFTVQCKYFSNPSARLTRATLREEVGKAKLLHSHGEADNYVLITNARLTASSEQELKAEFAAATDIQNVVFLGYEWLCAKIRESGRLRMLVPRVYGLGDLSQILDERGYDQAEAILKSLGSDLRKFVLTDSYTRAAKAAINKGFVLLLGRAGAGKSIIGATLAVGGIDLFKCRPMKVPSAAYFKDHWNTHERQFFWIDDAFGSTQYERDWALAWNTVLSEMLAAIANGSKILFTSRDYIYEAAIEDLKLPAFPLFQDSQVVIDVEKLSDEERKQILYNHLKLGNQPRVFKTRIKPFLDKIAVNRHFLPEIMRRLSDPMFTTSLIIDDNSLVNFVEKPEQYLVDVMKNLAPAMKGAVALVFMRAGVLDSPVECSQEEVKAVQRLGTSVSAAVRALKQGRDSFFLLATDDSRAYWRFRHPSMRDAFASLVASDAEVLHIYLQGAPIERIALEVSCGKKLEHGQKILVPRILYPLIARRLQELPEGDAWHSKHGDLMRFLSWRCGKDFLEYYIKIYPDIFTKCRLLGAYLHAYPSFQLVPVLFSHGLLPETERLHFVNAIKKITETTFDADFLNEDIRKIFTKTELEACILNLSNYMTRSMEREIRDRESEFEPEEGSSGEDHFEFIMRHLRSFRKELARRRGKKAREIVEEIERDVDLIKELARDLDRKREELPMEEPEPELRPTHIADGASNSRSVFEDVDE
jgi:hypothetical protein